MMVEMKCGMCGVVRDVCCGIVMSFIFKCDVHGVRWNGEWCAETWWQSDLM